MNDSAGSLRDLRKRETIRSLTDIARRLTVDHGFSGFTVEDVCAEAGISRRTFFNYFESKENAVFGFTEIDPRLLELEEEFVTMEGDLLDDFVAIMLRRWALLDPLSDAPALMSVIENEPRLLRGAFERLAENERRDVALIVRREGESEMLRAEVVVHMTGALVRMAVDQLLHHHSTESIEDLVLRRLDVARAAFATAPAPASASLPASAQNSAPTSAPKED
ncbi:TetR/AcrR family transcriptional regulator [Microbacterium foliorum]|uniref:TetR/AcrR family transcriptional regulator n=1 Tax=Microbacterium foliorum TaxID=104336 RepID=UPI001E06A795|nr:TetR/AcrR family transcriptional regulator [Microbacterium foliorum]CAH0167718.1 Putative mycofactocin biosynthesis transcriptional regulator MftR [Microbacterium foliorum]